MLPSNGMLIRNLIHETSDVQLIIGRPLSYRKFNIRGNFDVKVVKPLPKLVRQRQSKNCHKAYSPYQHVHQPGGLLTKRSLRGQKKGWVWTNCHAEYGDHGGNVSCRGQPGNEGKTESQQGRDEALDHFLFFITSSYIPSSSPSSYVLSSGSSHSVPGIGRLTLKSWTELTP